MQKNPEITRKFSELGARKYFQFPIQNYENFPGSDPEVGKFSVFEPGDSRNFSGSKLGCFSSGLFQIPGWKFLLGKMKTLITSEKGQPCFYSMCNP